MTRFCIPDMLRRLPSGLHACEALPALRALPRPQDQATISVRMAGCKPSETPNTFCNKQGFSKYKLMQKVVFYVKM
jgi:hypothetical protein